MASKHGARASAYAWLFSTVACAMLAVSCASPAVASVEANACYRDYPQDRPLLNDSTDSARLRDIVRVCGDGQIPGLQRATVHQLANARYYAGKAARILGWRAESAGQPAVQNYETAIANLERANELEGGRDDARLELAWANLGVNRHQQALALIDELLHAQTNPESVTHASAHYVRGLILHDRGAQGDGLSALDDWEVLVSDNFDEHPYAADARRKVVEFATRFGLQSLAMSTREETQRAIELFTRAQSAAESDPRLLPVWFNPPPQWPRTEFLGAQYLTSARGVEAADIFINLGTARLQMAQLQGRTGVAAFTCAAGDAAEDWLNLSFADFASAGDRAGETDRAHRGRACALLALGRTDEAIRAAERAVQLGPETCATQPALRRSENLRMQARAMFARAPSADAAEAFRQAAVCAVDSHERAHIIVEQATVLAHLAGVRDQEGDATQAAALRQQAAQLLTPVTGHPSVRPECERPQGDGSDSMYATAWLRLGKVLFDQRQFPVARCGLLTARWLTEPGWTEHDLVAHTNDAIVRAEALFLLSRLGTEQSAFQQDQKIGCPRRTGRCHAIELADEAFRLDATRRDYRDQSCLARIRFGRVSAPDQAEAFCGVAGQETPEPNGYVLQGMYHLRRAYFVSGDERHAAWESAYRSFSDGLRLLGDANTPEARTLRARLLQGQATAQFCVGFATLGHEQEASIGRQLGGADGPQLARNAHDYFEQHEVGVCPPRRR